VNCETDFVARNSLFQHFAQLIGQTAASTFDETSRDLDVPSLEATELIGSLNNEVIDRTQVGGAMAQLSSLMGEKISLGRIFRVAALPEGEGVVSGYLHNGYSPTTGRLGSLVSIAVDKAFPEDHQPLLQKLARAVAMQMAASKTRYIQDTHVPDKVRQRLLESSQCASESTKEAERGDGGPMIAQSVSEGGGAGRRLLEAFLDQNVLMRQEFVTFAWSFPTDGAESSLILQSSTSSEEETSSTPPRSVKSTLDQIAERLGVGRIYVREAGLIEVGADLSGEEL